MAQKHQLGSDRAKQKRSAVRARILVALFVLIMMGLGVALITLPEKVALVLFLLAPLVLGLAMAIGDRQSTEKALETIFRAIGAVIKFCGYLLIPLVLYKAAQWASDTSSAAIRYTALALLSGLLTLLVVGISTKNRRERLLRRNRSSATIGAVMLYCSSVVLLAVGTFGGVTKELSDRRLIELSPSPVNSGQLSDWYFWHLLDAIPLTNLTETLRWSAPFTYEDTRVGLLLVLYILTVVLPVINAFRELAGQRRPPSSRSDQAAASGGNQWRRSTLRHKPTAFQRTIVAHRPARRRSWQGTTVDANWDDW